LQQKLHISTCAGVIEALEVIFGKRIYADKAVERILKTNKKWGVRDRGFVAENTYDMVRNWRYLWACYDKDPILKRKELWSLFGIHLLSKGYTLPDWPKFDDIREFIFPDTQSWPLEVMESYPNWLHERASTELGDAWPPIALEMNKQAALIIRANTLKTDRDALIVKLAAEGIPSSPLEGTDAGIIMEKRVNNFRLNSFTEGLFEVQDGGSQQIAPALEVQPGMRVIDACAGAGGKSLQIAAAMQNQGTIIAMDVEGWKLNELKKRARRNGVHNIETREIEGGKTIKRLAASADRLLLDVPCSGTGVIKRNPDTKWKLEPEHVERVIAIQQEILESYAIMVKPGGRLVYATCSILRSENEDQVARFAEKHQHEFTLINMHRVHPGPYSDGFFHATFERKTENP
jgi:16S rRNA (cytosine967-C5)-methyltransferase